MKMQMKLECEEGDCCRCGSQKEMGFLYRSWTESSFLSFVIKTMIDLCCNQFVVHNIMQELKVKYLVFVLISYLITNH